jgi:hypothetical protein
MNEVATLVDEVRSESRQANISHAGSAPKKSLSREKKESNRNFGSLPNVKGILIKENQLIL